MKYLFFSIFLIFIGTNLCSNEKFSYNNYINKINFTSKINNLNEDNNRISPIPFLMFGIPGIIGGLSLTSSIILTIFYNTDYKYDGILAGMIASWITFGLSIITIIIELIVVFIIFMKAVVGDENEVQKKLCPGDNFLGIKIKISTSRN